MTYPVVEQRELYPVPKPGFLRTARRSIMDLPTPLPHQVLVFKHGGSYQRGDERLLRGDEPFVVEANSVSLVDLAKDRAVVAEIGIRSQGKNDFTVRVTFACTVVDPVQVVQSGTVHVSGALANYLKSNQRLLGLGLKHSLSEVSEVRILVFAEVKSATTYFPPIIPGMVVALSSVEVLTPSAVAEAEATQEVERIRVLASHDTRKVLQDIELDEQAHLQVKTHNTNRFEHMQQGSARDHQLQDAAKITNFMEQGGRAADGLFLSTPNLSPETAALFVRDRANSEWTVEQQARQAITELERMREQREHELRIVQERGRNEAIRAAISRGLFDQTTGDELLKTLEENGLEQIEQAPVEPAHESPVVAIGSDNDLLMEEDLRD
ncbi:hypothetical protein [Nonomuraea sp. NPDC050310]|uniref:hypothetical protein n=1 Tax=Nonomuraea sp. NPDC050310 TaxID=3154935 RepID=UPI0033ED7BC1